MHYDLAKYAVNRPYKRNIVVSDTPHRYQSRLVSIGWRMPISIDGPVCGFLGFLLRSPLSPLLCFITVFVIICVSL